MSVTTGTFPGVRIVDMPDLGAFTDDSSIVGEHAGSGRFGAVALRNYMGRGIVNVLDQGAVGNGTSDDTAAIQAVLNTYAGKAVVFIPDTGHPYLVADLVIPTGTDLLLHGWIKANPMSGTVLRIANASNVSIRGHGVVDCNGANQAAAGQDPATVGQAGVFVDTSTNVEVLGITIRDSINWNVDVVHSSHVRFNSVNMFNAGDSAEFAASSDDCWFVNCLIDGVHDIGVSFYGGVTNSGIIGSVVRNIGTMALPQNGIGILGDSAQPAPCTNILIADNVIHDCTGGGMYHDQVTPGQHHDGIIIANNICRNNGKGAVGAARNTDIGWNDCWNVTCIGNQSSNYATSATTGAIGIYVGGNANGSSIIGNHVYNAGHGGTTGTGLYVESANILWVSGNYFYQEGSSTGMATAIGGFAGLHNAYVGNYCDKPNTITSQPDTVSANVVNGQWMHGTGDANSDVAVAINAAGGHHASVTYMKGGIARWTAGTDSTPETGGNVGSDYAVVSYDDTGNQITRPFFIDRPSGIMIFAVPFRFVTLPLNFANDAAAAVGGLPVGAIYRNGSVIQVRVT